MREEAFGGRMPCCCGRSFGRAPTMNGPISVFPGQRSVGGMLGQDGWGMAEDLPELIVKRDRHHAEPLLLRVNKFPQPDLSSLRPKLAADFPLYIGAFKAAITPWILPALEQLNRREIALRKRHPDRSCTERAPVRLYLLELEDQVSAF